MAFWLDAADSCAVSFHWMTLRPVVLIVGGVPTGGVGGSTGIVAPGA